ncbi:ABC transporter ATP-binding protein [bacterium]|nr:ABC transporter ATP-binding protein [candidate division CSSED10-310 bacterium]
MRERSDILLDIQNMTVEFRTDAGTVTAVDDLNLVIHRGEIVSLVGESGCGKSVSSLAVMGLVPSPPGTVRARAIRFKGRDINRLNASDMQKIRGKEIAMIFQEPMTSLNPVFTIGNQIMEVIELHEKLSRRSARHRALEMLNAVSIPDPAKRIDEYPHQLSGGMRQRVMIAMALACNPELLIADEPTTALDVTIQAQIIDLLMRLRSAFGLAILLITHDMGIVAETADRVAVMYAGRLVEITSSSALFSQPLHPYTRGLLRSVPRLDTEDSILSHEGRNRLPTIDGSVPSLNALPPGCAFAPRCAQVGPLCSEQEQMMIRHPFPDHGVRCVLYEEKQP